MMKKLKEITSIVALIFYGTSNAQIGINTENPQSTLDINGNVYIQETLKLGNDTTSGQLGDLITTNNEGNVVWKNFNIPKGYGDRVISTSQILHSEKGIEIIGSEDSNLSTGYEKDSQINNNWVVIPGVTQNIKISNVDNTVNLNVQTLVQKDDTPNVSYACGIFIDNKLKAVRVGILRGDTNSFDTININASVQNLSKGDHQFKFACTERFAPKNVKLNFGAPNKSSILNRNMAQTSGNITVIEPGAQQ